MYSEAKHLIVGDHGISVEFGNDLSKDTNQMVRTMKYVLDQAALPGVIESIPTIRSLFVYYDPCVVRVDKLLPQIKTLEAGMMDVTLPKSKLFEIPVLYGRENGVDFDSVIKQLNLSPEEFIQIHSGREYSILQTGFVGGSAYFKLPPPLDSLPRKKTPNLGVPVGSVLMAGGLGSAFKPLAGPTGWYWIGLSPLRQWFPENDPPLLINQGDRIIYRPVNETEFAQIKKQVEDGRFDPERK